VEVTGLSTEGFLNRCAQEGIRFWSLERRDGSTLRLRVSWRDRRRLQGPADRTGCVVEELDRAGAPPFLGKFRRRYGFLVGLALALAAVTVLSRFILVIDVEGNRTVSTAEIRAELERQGLKPGAYGPGLAVREVADRALLELPELSWMAVNLYGTRAQVLVRERLEAPEVVDEDQWGDIVAKAPGIVTGVEVYGGDAAVAEGDTVLPGDVLIRGSVRMDPPQYSDLEPTYYPARAMGKVTGRTWRTLAAAAPLAQEGKQATGDEKSRWSLTIFGQRVNFYQNSGIPYGKCDKITRTWALALPGGRQLPFVLRRETYTAYETSETRTDPAAAQAMLEQALSGRLRALMGETGEVVSEHFSAAQRDGWLLVTLTAECREDLGRFVPAP